MHPWKFWHPQASEGEQSVEKAAQTRLKERLASYEKPAMDPDIEAAIMTYVEKRKQKELTPGE